jgi:hypothetical protein
MLMTIAMILLCVAAGFPLITPPINEPVLKAAKKVVMRLAQTKIEVPKKGARTRDATS